MKTLIKFKSLAVALMLLFSHMPNGHAGYEKLMAMVDEEFENADNKFAVITRPMNEKVVMEYLMETQPQMIAIRRDRWSRVPEEATLPSPAELYSEDTCKINALALAIGNGDVKRVRKFLEVVKDPADRSLLISGEWSRTNVVDFLTDFRWRWHNVNHYKDRLTIIDLLAEKKFNLTPPLFCWYSPDRPGTHCVYERLLLKGVDTHKGALHLRNYVQEKNFKELIDGAFKQVLHGEAKNIHPVPEVMKLLKEIKQDYLHKLSLINLDANFLPKEDKTNDLFKTGEILDDQERYKERARLLLEGADLDRFLKGMNYCKAQAILTYPNYPIDLAFKQVLNGEITNISPVPEVLKLLKPKKEALLEKIRALPF